MISQQLALKFVLASMPPGSTVDMSEWDTDPSRGHNSNIIRASKTLGFWLTFSLQYCFNEPEDNGERVSHLQVCAGLTHREAGHMCNEHQYWTATQKEIKNGDHERLAADMTAEFTLGLQDVVRSVCTVY